MMKSTSSFSCSTTFSSSCSLRGEPCPISSGKLLLYPIMGHTSSQFAFSLVGYFKQVSDMDFPQLVQSFLPPLPALLGYVAAIKFQPNDYSLKTITFISLILIFCLIYCNLQTSLELGLHDYIKKYKLM